MKMSQEERIKRSLTLKRKGIKPPFFYDLPKPTQDLIRKKISSAITKFHSNDRNYYKTKNSKGYIMIYDANHFSCKDGKGRRKRIPEHRYVMEKYLKRKLASWEVIHHINGNKEDNSIKNLQLLPNAIQHTLIENAIKRIKQLENLLIKYNIKVP